MKLTTSSYKTLKNITPAFFLLLLAFLVYANTFSNGWTYDDFPVIVENPDITSWSAFLEDSYASRPLREFTYLLDHALFGLNPAGWHIQNIFWHGLNAFLIFLLVNKTTHLRHAAWLASLIFLLHPIQVEVVANISHRKDSLALAFSLLATLFYFDFLHSGKKVRLLIPSLLCTCIAYLAKQNAAVLPLVFVTCEASLFSSKDRFILRSKQFALSCSALIVLAFTAWFIWGDGHLIYSRKWPPMLMKMDFFSAPSIEIYLLLLLKSWAFMLGKLVFPLNLGVEYTYSLPQSWIDPWVFSSLVIIFSFPILLFISFRRNKTLFFFLAWASLYWLPTSNIWPLSYFAADRYWYAPSAGFFAAFSIVLISVLSTKKKLLALFLPLLIILSILTWQKNRVWFSPETLWVQAVKVSPTSSFALNNLGNVYLLKNNLLKAREFYQKAVTANPSNPTSYYNLALIYERVGDTDNAIRNYRIFLSIGSSLFREQTEALKGYLLRKYGIIVK